MIKLHKCKYSHKVHSIKYYCACSGKLINVFNSYCSIKLCSFSFAKYILNVTWNHVKQTSEIYTVNVFEKIPRVPRESGWTYSRNVVRMKTGNLHRDVVIRRLINWDFKNNYAFKSKEMMNSSNYILVTYLSDIESKFIPCHCFRVLANLSF